MLLKPMQVLIILKFQILLILNYNLDTKSATKSKLIELLTQLKGFEFVTTLVLMFKKMESEDKTKYDNFYSSSKAEIIISENDIDGVYESILQLQQTYKNL